MAMFEKFSKLLFEDEDIDDEEYEDEDEEFEEEEEKPVKSNKKQNIFARKAGSLLKIDDDDEDEEDDDEVFIKKETKPVTQVLQTTKPVEQKPVVEEKTVVTEEKSSGHSFGLDISEITATETTKPRQVAPQETVKQEKSISAHDFNRPQSQPTQQQTSSYKPRPVNTTANELGGRVVQSTPKKTKPVVNTSNYIFSPVISPMFGVDEHEMEVFTQNKSFMDKQIEQNEASRMNLISEPVQENVHKVISPMYGSNIKPVIQEVKTENNQTAMVASAQPLDHTTVPYQSLDDLIHEGRSAQSEESLEATRAFKFEDLLSDNVEPVEKKVESPYSSFNLFSNDSENEVENHE